MPDRPVVIVTGSSGLIGSATSRRLLERYAVVGLDREGSREPPRGVHQIDADVTDERSLDRAFDEMRRTYGDRIASVVHLAAYYDFSGEKSEKCAPHLDRDIMSVSSHSVYNTRAMPKLWTATIETHRREVRDAIIATTADLVGKHGLPAVTMSRIADETGIGRATLYKYFPDVEAILIAWHDRHVEDHIRSLAEARDRSSDPAARLEAVLRTFASITYQRAQGHAEDPDHARHHGSKDARVHHGGQSHSHERHAGDIDALVHQSRHVSRVKQQLLELVRDVVREAARSGTARSDVPAEELARYALKALAAAGALTSRSAVERLVTVTLDGLRPQKQ